MGVLTELLQRTGRIITLCSPSDPYYRIYAQLEELKLHLIKGIEHLFSVYKDLKNKKVEIGSFANKSKALCILKECRERQL